MTRAEEAYWLRYFGWCLTYGIAIGAIFTASSRGDIFSMAAILIFQGIAVFKLLEIWFPTYEPPPVPSKPAWRPSKPPEPFVPDHPARIDL